jgi:hypothetical protein
MEQVLEQFVEEWRGGDRERAKALARDYVEAHREGLAKVLEPLSLDDIVQLIDSYRAVGQWKDVVIADMWLIANYEPQTINGSVRLGGGIVEAVTKAMNSGEPL